MSRAAAPKSFCEIGGTLRLFELCALAHDLNSPRLVRQVPINSLADSRFKGVLRAPSKLAVYLRRVDRVAAVVARPVLNKGDETAGCTLGTTPGGV